MRCSFSLRRTLFTLCAATAALNQAKGTLGQIGVLNPNPTMPADVSRGLGGYGASSGGIGIGRGPVPPGQAREENPADAMLKSIEGTNYGRYRGRALYSPDSSKGARPAPRGQRRRPAEAARARRGSSTAIAPNGGRPENRWRYRLFQGRWFYRMEAGRWSYFDGRRWVPYQGSRIAGRSDLERRRQSGVTSNSD